MEVEGAVGVEENEKKVKVIQKRVEKGLKS